MQHSTERLQNQMSSSNPSIGAERENLPSSLFILSCEISPKATGVPVNSLLAWVCLQEAPWLTLNHLLKIHPRNTEGSLWQVGAPATFSIYSVIKVRFTASIPSKDPLSNVDHFRRCRKIIYIKWDLNYSWFSILELCGLSRFGSAVILKGKLQIFIFISEHCIYSVWLHTSTKTVTLKASTHHLFVQSLPRFE